MQLPVLESGQVRLTLTLKSDGNLRCWPQPRRAQQLTFCGFSHLLLLFQASRVLKHQNTFLFPPSELHKMNKQQSALELQEEQRNDVLVGRRLSASSRLLMRSKLST